MQEQSTKSVVKLQIRLKLIYWEIIPIKNLLSTRIALIIICTSIILFVSPSLSNMYRPAHALPGIMLNNWYFAPCWLYHSWIDPPARLMYPWSRDSVPIQFVRIYNYWNHLKSTDSPRKNDLVISHASGPIVDLLMEDAGEDADDWRWFVYPSWQDVLMEFLSRQISIKRRQC